MKNKLHGPWYFEQHDLGFNYRMSEIHAALGLSQLKRLNKFTKKRNQIAKNYELLLKGLPLRSQKIVNRNFSSYHLYIIRLNLEKIEKSKEAIFNSLRKKGIGVQVHYIPIHYHPFFQELNFKKGDFPNTEKYYEEALSLPIYPDLKKSEQLKVVKALKECIT